MVWVLEFIMLKNRPPIVVILGHVDHGKTTLLDYLRKSNVAAREAGGITQHIKSFQLTTDNRQPITFIDTPGHAAFSQMRSRGSLLADIAILVVAGGDGVMPQTKESIQFIKSAGISFIVAITKSDLPGFNADHVKTQLTESDVIVEDLGGEVPAVSVSAKNGEGIADLLETIDLLAGMNPPQADPQGVLEAVVLESRLDNHKGPLAAVVVRSGQLITGKHLYMDKNIGKVRALLDWEGRQLASAGPSLPVEILGLSTVPPVGSIISDHPVTAESTSSSLSAPLPTALNPLLNIVLKTDVLGSLEALSSALPTGVNMVSSGTGDVTESDVLQAKASSARIYGFNVKTSSSVVKLASVEKVPLSLHRVIYELLEDIESRISPVVTEVVTGRAQILAEFKIDKERVAGCKCTEGEFNKSDSLQLLRGGQTLGSTRFKSLRSGKSSVSHIKTGAEFGVVFSPYLDFKPGDNIIAVK
ncbi:MAG: Translation initiation factor IF-2 [Candidatus Amesbacteria bacterium GW2011_GWA1_47_16]|uniref:Translation initiation factor IF-2 n=5 Tax=Microgenomates group TaxID=1794810 RepID=A0A0G1S6Z7_9BACT|nr:MAG: Translation initiation factor IF-2 [Candidatus Amesbacteria bacterium GW2011_GWA1_47_16]KKU65147.1 MAG: Translation initiation factor IF-2 [Candidatus Amesbacteria bacterium GW2011_GWC1_47_15]KKU98493.1 MAG: Translation initiation factor IF-2 [Candidatus Amesbacteria bacterium GW2011_GWB1_48_13]OGD00292.1 MAG: hypothetical protein A2972_00595 [Candidatus Amesbacteria bacterium RIFCSPLOWO2_01_FULL_47_33]OGD00864.1 MAG: hypothetical protein A2701_00435 [Candidatus Amesbacteria bacterium R